MMPPVDPMKFPPLSGLQRSENRVIEQAASTSEFVLRFGDDGVHVSNLRADFRQNALRRQTSGH
jgi:hypothetical protein